MNIIITLIIGGVVGWLGSIIMKTNAQMGIIANVVVGVVGSLLGLWIAGQLGFGGEGGTIVALLIQIGGAVVLIAILKALKVFK